LAVKCQHCGKENPETEAFCKFCGRELVQTGARKCVSCGRPISWDVNVCPYCGKDYRVQPMAQQEQPQVSSGMKILLYIVSLLVPLVGFIIGAIYYSKGNKEYKDMGAICIVLGVFSFIIAIPLSGFLYVLIVGFGGSDGTSYTQVIIINRVATLGGQRINFLSISENVEWSDIMMQLTDTWDFVNCIPLSTDLTGAPPTVASYGPMVGLSGLDVVFNITDLAGNGIVSSGDYMTLTASSGSFSIQTSYTLTLIYGPTGQAITSISFTG